MIEIEHLVIRTPAFTLGPLHLNIGAGNYCVLLGPSGSGKTSLLEWVAGFRKAESGRLCVAGHDVTHAAPGRRDLALVFQEAALFPHLSVTDNIAFSLKMQGVARAERERRAVQAAELLHIGHRLVANPRTLSGGEARRVALARAVASPRPVLLLDEPLSAVDPALHRELIALLRQLHEELELTVVHVTHSLFEARNLATHIGVIIDGRLVQHGEAKSVFENPTNDQVARALGLSNYLEGSLTEEGDAFYVQGQTTTLPVLSSSGGGSRARVSGLTLATQAQENTRPAMVISAEVSGSGAESLHVRLDESDVELEIPMADGFALGRVGEVTYVDFQKAHWRLF